MPRSARLYLAAIEENSTYILTRTEGRTLESYTADKDLRYAVERAFITIGEALSALQREFPETLTSLANVRQIIALRHLLAHKYWDVDDEQMWSTIVTDLATFRDQVGRLIRDAPAP